MTLTAAGEVLLEHARILLDRADRARAEVRCADGRHRHLELRLVTAVEYVLDPMLHQISGPASGLEVTIATATGREAIRAVRAETADAAIVWGRSADEQDLSGTVLRQIPVHLALPAQHRLAASAAIAVADLATEAIVMFPRDLFLGIWDHIIGHLLPAGLSRPDQVLTQPDLINVPEAVLRSVAAGHGVAPVAPAMAEHLAVAGTVIRPLNPSLLVPLELVWREPPPPGLERVIAMLAGNPGVDRAGL
ncbi:LysR family transcriptional regulator [Promicromonospora umidemergens]|uniref:LysR family transcriptional regulator n=1 Tax=Promicromonospora umidemergens TaxID=629679 RepID=A0ABP8YCX0_9MICO